MGCKQTESEYISQTHYQAYRMQSPALQYLRGIWVQRLLTKEMQIIRQYGPLCRSDSFSKDLT